MASPNVLGRKPNHHNRKNRQCGHLEPEVIGKTALARDLTIHCSLTSLGSRREKATRLGKGSLSVAPLSRFFGFRHCHSALVALVGA